MLNMVSHQERSQGKQDFVMSIHGMMSILKRPMAMISQETMAHLCRLPAFRGR